MITRHLILSLLLVAALVVPGLSAFRLAIAAALGTGLVVMWHQARQPLADSGTTPGSPVVWGAAIGLSLAAGTAIWLMLDAAA